MINTQNENGSPRVSIIIPSYNGEEFIREAIDSVLNQTFQDFELIISDDASTDKTREIAQEYSSDPRISFFQNNKQLGIGGNWNRGIERSKGRYIKILCQDDIIKPGYLEKSVEVLENDESVSLVTTFEQFFGESDRVRNQKEIPFTKRVNGTNVQKSVLKNGNWIGGPTAVTFRRANLSVGMFDSSLKCGLDYEMWLRLLTTGDLYVVPEILFQSRIHKGQATTGCQRNLGFDKDKIRILNKINESPKMYGGLDTTIVREVLERSVRLYVDKSLNSDAVRISSVLMFLNQNIGFPGSISSLTRGVILRSLYRFRLAIKETD